MATRFRLVMAMQRTIQRIHSLVDTPRLKSFSLNAPKSVDVEYANGIKFSLSAEFLRVYSPAADGKIRSIGSEKVYIWLHLTALIEHKALSNLNVYFMMLSLF
uniref:Gamma-butyrobetaine hydroxylase-like N-terminal domain-containing protein n=1 Tax=Gossypium raimondii TaxID=29730 RepID=A0A0D2NET0_GOSRA|nr:hypothetical protein B456_001G267900 [Gossypium raimondii]